MDGEEEGKTAHRESGPTDQGGEEGAKRTRKEKHCEHEEAPMMCDGRRMHGRRTLTVVEVRRARQTAPSTDQNLDGRDPGPSDEHHNEHPEMLASCGRRAPDVSSAQ
ncbi:hypothetical protein GCM10015535_37590 [Streptomyces gelaticus]|uniref:Uncharacterized protein n=1 Tax=Streptomyces gelaticus TaxID=285446 RepID=A0ABQ2W0G1_9ACTN|nr:hypothetical protein GCM10015535_37590 [Streptomyces gelaticus]